MGKFMVYYSGIFQKGGIHMNQVAVLIPAHNPDRSLVQYVQKLLHFGFPHIILVHDDSTAQQELEAISRLGAHVLPAPEAHDSSVKTGLRYYQQCLADRCMGVITVDSDGRQEPADIAKVAGLLEQSDLVLGTGSTCRRMPAAVFSLLYQTKLPDILSGIRGIANRRLPALLELPEQGTKFRIRMLTLAAQEKWPMAHCPVKAPSPLGQGEQWSIYQVILGCFMRFLASSLLSSALDVLLFALCTKVVFVRLDVVTATFWANVIARVLSSLANYYANKKLVFQHNESTAASLFRFTLLCIGQTIGSWLMIVGMNFLTHWDTTILKMIADCLLFFASYPIQQKWVFPRNREE